IDFNWKSGRPGGTVPADNWSAQWTGKITVPAAVGNVTLAALSDDGVRVWVDGQLCIGNWGPNNSATTESTVTLNAGQTHQLKVQYVQFGGNDLITLEWRGANAAQSVWIPPGNWINAWTGGVLGGPTTIIGTTPLEETPLYIRSGSVFALAPQMEYTGQLPWDPITLDVYPSTTESDQTSLYEDDTLTTAYKQGQYRTTPISIWANNSSKTVSVSIGAAVGSFSGASAQRSWVVRLHRPPNWSADLAPTQVTVNGRASGTVIRRVRNTSAMPLGANNGAPDADVFEVTLPESSVFTSNLVVATFAFSSSPWVCGDIGDTGANGNVNEGGSTCSNSVWILRGGGAGIGGTNDGFHFLYQPCISNVELTVHLDGQQSTNAWAEAGIIISESLSPSARNALVAFTPGNGLVFQSRSVAGSSGETAQVGGFSLPCWLRILRSGNTLAGYVSPNNAQWTQVGTITIPGFNAQAYIGLAVTADTSTQIAQENRDCTNSTGTVVVGASPEILNGIYSVDDTNYNRATFDNLSLNPSVSIATLPNQTTSHSAATSPIPFIVNASGGAALSVNVASSIATCFLINQSSSAGNEKP
ncbi:MAG TPA: PA14 domain-containing protein, partial [Verrucomicrobiae bacterium]|nr:PA14 domain-containing protein [Verrucomicrobiae bacterium]